MERNWIAKEKKEKKWRKISTVCARQALLTLPWVGMRRSRNHTAANNAVALFSSDAQNVDKMSLAVLFDKTECIGSVW
jgi:hypothetical protein